MEMQFRQLDQAIESQPMPPQFEDTKARVYCNDCSAKTSVKYHWLGSKCAVCDSYNTAQIQIWVPEELDLGDDNFPGSQTGDLHVVDSAEHSTRTRPTGSLASLRGYGSSNPALETERSSEYAAPDSRMFRSISSVMLNQPMTTEESSGVLDDPDPMETDEEYDDVDFWGGESPRERAKSQVSTSNANDNEVEGGDDEDDEEDSETDSMDNDSEDDDDDDDDDDYMVLCGHR
ncbi:hypothetical protein MMC20_001218 [Loxospora ochrophaea]|nr:hypothetical protein [Loxospora ochrophaea]